MLQSKNPIDELLALPDSELRGQLKKDGGIYPKWVREYVDFVLSGGHASEEYTQRRLYH